MALSTEHFRPVGSIDQRWQLVLAILVLGLGLRAWGLSGQSLSGDEVWELQHAPRGLMEIARTADGFPPLYSLLLHGWLDLLPGGVGARWLSVVFGVMAIYFGWLLGRRVGGEPVGLWSALFIAVSPLHIWYSQEARSYALYILLATVALWGLLRAVESNSLRDWALFGAAATAGMYTHYYFAVVLLLGAILTLRRRRNRRMLRRPVAAYAAVAALCLPLLWLIPADWSLQAGWAEAYPFGLPALCYTYVSLITGYTLGPSLRELHSMRTAEAFLDFLPWLAVMAPPLIILGYHGRRVLGNPAFGRLVLLSVAPVVMIGVLGLLASVGYNVRYAVWVVVPVAVVLAAGSTRWRRWPVAASLLVLLGLFGIALANRRFTERYQNEDLRGLSAYLLSQPGSRIPVFALSEYIATPVRYYLGRERTIYAVQSSAADSSRVFQALEVISSKTGPGEPYWLVYSREFHGDPQGSVRNALEQRDSLHLVARFAGVALYRGVRPDIVPQESTETSARPHRSAS